MSGKGVAKGPPRTKGLDVILVGDCNVGKSCILKQKCEQKFYANFAITVGMDFRFQDIRVDDQVVKLKIWDTMGQERYARNMMPMYYRGAEAAILVYDITSISSFHSLTRWLRDIKEYREVDDIVMAVVGNKADCASEREVFAKQGQEFAERNGMMFMETSAKTGQNVEELFCAIARKLRSRGRERAKDDITVDLSSRSNSSSLTAQQSSRCCSFGSDPDYSLPDSPQFARKVARQTSSPSATVSSKPTSQTPTRSAESHSKQDGFLARSPARSLSYTEAKSSGSQTRGKRKSKQLTIADLHQVRLELESASNVWFELGLALGLLHPKLRQIEEDYSQDMNKCLREMLAEWLYHDDIPAEVNIPTWDQLTKALRELKCDALAKEIEKNHR